MRTIVMTAIGGPEVLEAREMPIPEPGPGQVLVRVHAASVNPIDWKLRRLGFWGITPPVILGYDVAGVVERVGDAVDAFRPGDAVWYLAPLKTHGGGYAEYHAVDANVVAHKPPELSFEEAASIPLAGATAYQCLVEGARLQAGETVLIHAGAGGVGSLAIQIAKRIGAHVITTCRRENFDLVSKLGAEVVIDYRHEDFVEATLNATGGAGVHVCFDTVGGETLQRSFEVVTRSGRLPSITERPEPEWTYLAAPNNVHFWRELVIGSPRKLAALGDLIEREELRPVIDSVLPLSEAAEAHRRLEAGGVRGKIVLRIAES